MTRKKPVAAGGVDGDKEMEGPQRPKKKRAAKKKAAAAGTDLDSKEDSGKDIALGKKRAAKKVRRQMPPAKSKAFISNNDKGSGNNNLPGNGSYEQGSGGSGSRGQGVSGSQEQASGSGLTHRTLALKKKLCWVRAL